MAAEKTNNEYIVDALLAGDTFRSPELRQKVSEISGKEFKIQDIASLMSKLTDPSHCDLGFFIKKEKSPTDKGYIYRLVDEVRELPREILYGLIRKTGPKRYPIAKLLEEHPELEKYVDHEVIKRRELGKKKRGRKKKELKAAAPSRRRKKAREAPAATAEELPMTTNIISIMEILAGFLSKISSDGLNFNFNLNITIRDNREK